MSCRQIGVALKWAPFAGVDGGDADARYGGLSAADQAALEIALCFAAAWDCPTLAVSVGAGASRDVLVQALSVGVTGVVHVDAPSDLASARVAALLARAFAGCDVVICGDYSRDRGSGSTPAFLAAELEAEQALGLSAVVAGSAGTVVADRRLEAGRRERLRLTGQMVLSVESSVARLRRAKLPGLMAARSAPIPSRDGRDTPEAPSPAREGPFRPRAKVLAPPSGLARERIERLTGLTLPLASRQTVELSPAAAADRIARQLEGWGYLKASG
jgi:electron transfer flavoprotein beta subunit